MYPLNRISLDRLRRLLHVAFCAILLTFGDLASAHDPSAYGGLFRSRDFGGVWLNADVGLFLGGALSLAVSPVDPNHLLLGTDSYLMATRSGGRNWRQEAPDMLYGAIFAVAFLPDGKSALCATPAGVFRFDGDKWAQASAPAEAAPARAILAGADPARVYLVGRRDLFRSDDAGRTWSKVGHDLADQPEFTDLALAIQPREVLYAVADGRVMVSEDMGANWRPRHDGLPANGVDALSVDPAMPQRLWAAAADRVHRSDDAGLHWQVVGEPLPEPGTSVRGIAADPAGDTLVLTTHRGMYRSTDGAKTWGLLEGNLPVHLEARPLVRDPAHAGTLYAGYALMPYGEIWRMAVEGGNLLGKVDPVSLAGGLAFLLLLCLAGFYFARWLVRRRDTSPPLARNAGP